MLMQEFIKKIINIHKCKFLKKKNYAGCGLMQAGPIRAYMLTTLVHPAFFFLRTDPTDQTLITTPKKIQTLKNKKM